MGDKNVKYLVKLPHDHTVKDILFDFVKYMTVRFDTECGGLGESLVTNNLALQDATAMSRDLRQLLLANAERKDFTVAKSITQSTAKTSWSWWTCLVSEDVNSSRIVDSGEINRHIILQISKGLQQVMWYNNNIITSYSG